MNEYYEQALEYAKKRRDGDYTGTWEISKSQDAMTKASFLAKLDGYDWNKCGTVEAWIKNGKPKAYSLRHHGEVMGKDGKSYRETENKDSFQPLKTKKHLRAYLKRWVS